MGNNAGTDMAYPLDQMRQVAAAILAQADLAQSQHDQTWQQITQYIQNTVDAELHEPMMTLLQPYAIRLRATYVWQIDLATALFDAIDLMDTTDQGVANTFTPQGNQHGYARTP